MDEDEAYDAEGANGGEHASEENEAEGDVEASDALMPPATIHPSGDQPIGDGLDGRPRHAAMQDQHQYPSGSSGESASDVPPTISAMPSAASPFTSSSHPGPLASQVSQLVTSAESVDPQFVRAILTDQSHAAVRAPSAVERTMLDIAQRVIASTTSSSTGAGAGSADGAAAVIPGSTLRLPIPLLVAHLLDECIAPDRLGGSSVAPACPGLTLELVVGLGKNLGDALMHGSTLLHEADLRRVWTSIARAIDLVILAAGQCAHSKQRRARSARSAPSLRFVIPSSLFLFLSSPSSRCRLVRRASHDGLSSQSRVRMSAAGALLPAALARPTSDGAGARRGRSDADRWPRHRSGRRWCRHRSTLVRVVAGLPRWVVPAGPAGVRRAAPPTGVECVVFGHLGFDSGVPDAADLLRHGLAAGLAPAIRLPLAPVDLARAGPPDAARVPLADVRPNQPRDADRRHRGHTDERGRSEWERLKCSGGQARTMSKHCDVSFEDFAAEFTTFDINFRILRSILTKVKTCQCIGDRLLSLMTLSRLIQKSATTRKGRPNFVSKTNDFADLNMFGGRLCDRYSFV